MVLWEDTTRGTNCDQENLFVSIKLILIFCNCKRQLQANCNSYTRYKYYVIYIVNAFKCIHHINTDTWFELNFNVNTILIGTRWSNVEPLFNFRNKAAINAALKKLSRCKIWTIKYVKCLLVNIVITFSNSENKYFPEYSLIK